MLIRIPIGQSDFRSLREQGLYYVDKTTLLRELIDLGTQVFLIPRPRRFGKTLNLTTMRWFFERSEEDLSPLFADLAIWRAGDEYRRHFQRYPVIYLTFKDVKARTWPMCLAALAGAIADAYRQHRRLLDEGVLPSDEAAAFDAILRGEATEPTLWKALGSLSRQLAAFHREKVVILIDEYDTPIHAGHANGFYDEVTGFFRNFLSGGFKDNNHLYKGVLTGILRVARESIFSGLNNIAVHSILEGRFATAFGFTEYEVSAILDALGESSLRSDVQRAYNGYLFGGQVIYNPWSILNFAAAPEEGVRPYWVFTSSDDILRRVVLERGEYVGEEFAALMEGKTIRKALDEHIILRDLERSPESVWSLLYFSGYLTARNVELVDESTVGDLYIPNREVRYVFEKSVTTWTQAGVGGEKRLSEMLQSMLAGDVLRFERHLSELVRNTFSYHDTGGREPERVYQAFILGTLVALQSEYEVRSNREAGFGRYDVMVSPRAPGKPGVVFEFKEADGDDKAAVDRALDEAAAQIASLDYAAELRARGASPIRAYAVVFDGKRVWVRASVLDAPRP